jgi:hypothetical protein
VSDHASSNGQTNESQPVPPEDLVYYTPGTTFPGVIGRTFDRSTAAWPRPNWAREGAPNVLFIVLDDTGFGQLGCYGSPIATPNIDALAADGLRYTSMHTTALCSPTRSCILTGRNHHSNHLKGRKASPVPTATCRSRTACFRRCCSSTATTHTPSANGT